VDIADFGQVARVLHGFIFVVDGADGLGIIVLHEIDLGAVALPLRISTRFVFLHPFAAFFLSVALNFEKIAVFAVPVIVASASGVAGSSTRS
jgi:hypothetical protein